jgi:hypothetical protein
MSWDVLLVGLFWLAQPITAFVAGVVGYAALRDGLDWRGVRIAAAWLAGPPLACLAGLPLLGDSDTGGVAEFAWFVGSIPTLIAIAVAVAIAMGVVYRLGTENDRIT